MVVEFVGGVLDGERRSIYVTTPVPELHVVEHGTPGRVTISDPVRAQLLRVKTITYRYRGKRVYGPGNELFMYEEVTS